MALEEYADRGPVAVDVDTRVLNDLQLMRFTELEGILRYEGVTVTDEVRGLFFECLRNKKTTSECLDTIFERRGVDRGNEESGVDFNTVGVRDRDVLRQLSAEAAAIRFVSTGRDFDFVDYKPVDLQGLHRYLCIDVFGDINRVTHDMASQISSVFDLMPEKRVLDRAEGREFAMRMAPFCAALLSAGTFPYNDTMVKRLFIMELARSYGWDLHLRDVPVSSLRSTLATAADRPDMFSRLLRAQVTDMDANRDEIAESRFAEIDSKPGFLKRFRDWVEGS